MIEAPTARYEYPWLDMDPGKIVSLLKSLQSAGFRYESGPGVGKINPLSDQALDVPPSARTIDCSGFTRWAIYHALGQPEDFDFPDGSVNQHSWVDAKGFKASDYASGTLEDGAIRIAFLSPEDAVQAGMSPNERHVMLLVNGYTCESHGGHGPDQRAWGSQPWMKFTQIYCLTPPTNER